MAADADASGLLPNFPTDLPLHAVLNPRHDVWTARPADMLRKFFDELSLFLCFTVAHRLQIGEDPVYFVGIDPNNIKNELHVCLFPDRLPPAQEENLKRDTLRTTIEGFLALPSSNDCRKLLKHVARVPQHYVARHEGHDGPNIKRSDARDLCVAARTLHSLACYFFHRGYLLADDVLTTVARLAGTIKNNFGILKRHLTAGTYCRRTEIDADAFVRAAETHARQTDRVLRTFDDLTRMCDNDWPCGNPYDVDLDNDDTLARARENRARAYQSMVPQQIKAALLALAESDDRDIQNANVVYFGSRFGAMRSFAMADAIEVSASRVASAAPAASSASAACATSSTISGAAGAMDDDENDDVFEALEIKNPASIKTGVRVLRFSPHDVNIVKEFVIPDVFAVTGVDFAWRILDALSLFLNRCMRNVWDFLSKANRVNVFLGLRVVRFVNLEGARVTLLARDPADFDALRAMDDDIEDVLLVENSVANLIDPDYLLSCATNFVATCATAMSRQDLKTFQRLYRDFASNVQTLKDLRIILSHHSLLRADRLPSVNSISDTALKVANAIHFVILRRNRTHDLAGYNGEDILLDPFLFALCRKSVTDAYRYYAKRARAIIWNDLVNDGQNADDDASRARQFQKLVLTALASRCGISAPDDPCVCVCRDLLRLYVKKPAPVPAMAAASREFSYSLLADDVECP